MNVHEFLSFFYDLGIFLWVGAETFSYQQVWELFGSYFGMQYASHALLRGTPLNASYQSVNVFLLRKCFGIRVFWCMGTISSLYGEVQVKGFMVFDKLWDIIWDEPHIIHIQSILCLLILEFVDRIQRLRMRAKNK